MWGQISQHSAPSLPGKWSSHVSADFMQSLFLGFLAVMGGGGDKVRHFLAAGTLEKLNSLAIFSRGCFPCAHLTSCPVLKHEQTLLRRSAKLVSLLHAQVDEDNCPAISPSLESLSFLLLSDNGIVCVVGRQGKFIFIKCCFNISFSSSQIFHQAAPFCGKLDFHFPDLLGMFPPSFCSSGGACSLSWCSNKIWLNSGVADNVH